MIFRLMMVTGLLLMSMGNAYADNSDAAWQQAKSSNSIESLRAFIRKHPGSDHLAEAGKALYKQSVAANKLSALSDFYEEFPDFPQAKKAKSAYYKLLKKQSGLDIRHTFHQGKIGTLYVPSVTNSYPSTTTHYINGHAINETTYHDSSSGGYNSDRYGYTAVYQIFNNSDKNYIVTVRASGTSTMSEMGVSTGSWSGEQSTYTNHNRKHFSQKTSYLLKAKSESKDQLVTGETQPNDFKVIVVKAVPVSDEWISGLQEALKSENHESTPDGWVKGLVFKAKQYIEKIKEPSVSDKLARIKRYLSDPKATKWQDALQRRYSYLAEKHISYQIEPGERFDRDFSSKVKVIFNNNTGYSAKVYFHPNFAGKSMVELAADANKTVGIVANGVSKDNLAISFDKILPNDPVSQSGETSEHQALLKQYKKGIQSRASVVRERKRKAAVVRERKRKAREKKRKDAWEKARKNPLESIQKQMVTIPSGNFMMGSNNGDSDEMPVHRVYIHSFKMGKYEVMQAQWQAVMGNNPSGFKGTNLPVDYVSWDDIQRFIGILNEATGKNFRLPTEAEWEYAARAGSTTKYSWGDSVGHNRANCKGCGSQWDNKKNAPVGSFSPNKFGLYDMHGNISEWVADWYDESYYRISPKNDPKGPSSGRLRINRGGYWGNGERRMRSAHRGGNKPGDRSTGLGFRLVQD